MNNQEIIESLQRHHRARRYWMKVQQKLDRALESYIRINYTDWTTVENEANRKKESAKALVIIKAAEKGDGGLDLVVLVGTTIAARVPADTERKNREKTMAEIVLQLPVYAWVKSIAGFGELGLATIVGLTGDLSNYANVGKIWKRLMLAPYDGFAGSTWKRETWRPRALTKEEWIANPFSGERYAMIAMIADSLHKKQVMGKEKSGTEFGKPLGPYGAVYISRRERTKDRGWSLMRAHRDALRIMVKTLIRDLWVEWQRCANPKFVNKPWRPDDKPWRPELIAAE